MTTTTAVRRLTDVLSARSTSLGAQLILADDVHTELVRSGADRAEIAAALNAIHRLDALLTLAIESETLVFEMAEELTCWDGVL